MAELSSYERDRRVVASIKKIIEEVEDTNRKCVALSNKRNEKRKEVEFTPDVLQNRKRLFEENESAIKLAERELRRLELPVKAHEDFAQAYCTNLEKIYKREYLKSREAFMKKVEDYNCDRKKFDNYTEVIADEVIPKWESGYELEGAIIKEQKELLAHQEILLKKEESKKSEEKQINDKRKDMWNKFCKKHSGYALNVQLRRFKDGTLRFMIERNKFKAKVYLFFHRKAIFSFIKSYLELYTEWDRVKAELDEISKDQEELDTLYSKKEMEYKKVNKELLVWEKELKEHECQENELDNREKELEKSLFFLENESCSPELVVKYNIHVDFRKELEKQMRSLFPGYLEEYIVWVDTYQTKESVDNFKKRLMAKQEEMCRRQKSLIQSKGNENLLMVKEREEVDAKIKDIEKEYERSLLQLMDNYYKLESRYAMLERMNPLLISSSRNYKETADRIEQVARETTVVPYLIKGWETKTLESDGSIWMIPQFKQWHDPVGGWCNFIINYARKDEESAFRFMNQLLLNMVLALPPKKLKFAFVDLNMANAASFFTINFDGQLYHGGPITTEEKFRRYLEQLQDRIMTDVFKRCDNLIKYNAEHRIMLSHYEVIVLFDYPESYSSAIMKLLRPLCQNGYKAGVFFMVMRPKGAMMPGGQFMDITEIDTFVDLQIPEMNEQKMRHGSGVDFSFILNNEELMRECIRRVNEGLEREDAISTIYQDTAALAARPYEDAGDEFRVAVGETNGRVQWFRLDEVEHVHGFVLGKSGSGKSVFLHDVIANAILQYSPESLQLYLLDFKLGGVEFNRYRDVKHVRALLVDNSDRQIVLEILRDIYARMKRRGELMREAGASNLKEYNRMHPENRFARIVLVVDECHELFQERVDKVQAEINRIVTKISKEGRNQGVHFIFATQTLPASGNISPDILKNVTDYYLLKSAPMDADRLVRDSGRQVAQLSTGWLLYNNSTTSEVFQAYFRDKERLEEEIAEVARKSAGFPEGGRFFFSGKQTFAVDAALPGELKAVADGELVAMPGRNINVGLKPVGFPLRTDVRENVLLFGVNNREQCSRVTLNVLLSLMASARVNGIPCRFSVLNGFKDAGRRVHASRFLTMLEMSGCEVVERGRWGEFLMSVLAGVREGRAERQVIVMLGQENFRELEWNEEIVVGQESRETVSAPAAERVSHLGDMEVPEFLRGLDAPLPRLSAERKPTRGAFRDVVGELLKRGPEAGVHVVLEVDSLSKLLFEEVVTPQRVYALFNHVVMLRSPEEVNHKLRLPEEVRLDVLSDEQDMLRAYYHNHVEDTYTLFTPYVYPDAEVVKDLLDK